MKKKTLIIPLLALTLAGCHSKYAYSSLNDETFSSYVQNIKSIHASEDFGLKVSDSFTYKKELVDNFVVYDQGYVFNKELSSINDRTTTISYNGDEHVYQILVEDYYDNKLHLVRMTNYFVVEKDDGHYSATADMLTMTYTLGAKLGDNWEEEFFNEAASLVYKETDLKEERYLEPDNVQREFDEVAKQSTNIEWDIVEETRSIGGKYDSNLEIYYLDECKTNTENGSYRTVQVIYDWVQGIFSSHFQMFDEQLLKEDDSGTEVYKKIEETFSMNTVVTSPIIEELTLVE